MGRRSLYVSTETLSKGPPRGTPIRFAMPFHRVVVAIAVLTVTACSSAPTSAPGTLHVVATTSTLASLAQGVAGNSGTVASLVPVGVSPEEYQPTPGSMQTLHDAGVLIENGAGLEAWLGPTLRNAANAHVVTVVCTDGMPVKNGNPHLWMDPVFARTYVMKIRDAMIAADPAHAAEYRANAASYDAKLVALARRTQAKILKVPAAQRAMIVFHNAFDYYGARFGVRIIGAVEPQAGSEPNPAHLADLIRLAQTNHVRAIFAEHEFSPKIAEALQRNAGVKTLAYLYDDSVGTDPAVADYIGMIDYDTDHIVAALS